MRRKLPSWARPIARRLGRLAAELGPFGFRYFGVLVQHRGIILNQQGVAQAIAEALQEIGRIGRGARAGDIVRRIEVEVLEGGPGLHMKAAWTGGIWDRGIVTVRLHDHWTEEMKRGIVALVLEEMRADGRIPQHFSGEGPSHVVA
ncbi:MAG: hypothetical protein GY871_04610 [Actinomycetales bacterium]|nr:hypothetical protein [Actinomycetales bacterium]